MLTEAMRDALRKMAASDGGVLDMPADRKRMAASAAEKIGNASAPNPIGATPNLKNVL